jgi:multicomponent Na+:H+ antiporter subunit E
MFAWEIVKANWDVAKRVVTPTVNINPGIVKIKTKLKSNLGRLVLANSITLTPGTLTIDVIDDTLYIHWIDVSTQDVQKASEEIAAVFEKYLEVICG